MSGTRFVLTLLALLLLFLGGGYAVNHWQDMQTRLTSAPLLSPAPSVEPSASDGRSLAAGEADDQMSGSSEGAGKATTGSGIEVAEDGSSPPVVDDKTSGDGETRLRKEFDTEAADAAADAIASTEAIGSAAESPAPDTSTAGTRSAVTPQVALVVTLDVVELSATGTSVIAGQAPEGTKVNLLANGKDLGSSISDESGAWTLIVDEPLAPGDYKLTLVAVGVDGGDPVSRDAGEVTLKSPTGETVAPSADGAETSAVVADSADTAPAPGAEGSSAVPVTPEVPAAADIVLAPLPGQIDYGTVPPDLAMVVGTPAEPSPSPVGSETLGGAGDAVDGGTVPDTQGESPVETAQATEPVPTMEADPSLVDQAGEAADAISNMFTDWLTTTNDEVEAAARSFTISSATYRPIAKGKGVLTLSGRGPAEAEVRLFVDQTPVGTTRIADTGRWLADADHWIEPGGHTARAEIVGAGGEVLAGQDLAFVSAGLPETVASAADAAGPEAADGPAILLAISEVTYENMGPKRGRITVEGRSEPGARIEVFADGKSIGESQSSETGDWLMASDTWIDTGAHAIRAEKSSATGVVTESTLTEFVRPAAETVVASTEGNEGELDAAPMTTDATSAAPTRPHKTVKAKKRLAKGKRARRIARAKRLAKQRAAKRHLRTRTVNVVRGSHVSRVRIRIRSHKSRVLGFIRRRPPGWYRVRRGDSLWKIADRCYGDGRHYPVILSRNARSIRDPDLIFPRQRLFVP
ncbi:MAG: LysM peptidoglycan-binding domain-containing protein [Hyphomicrobiaceae bacterium]